MRFALTLTYRQPVTSWNLAKMRQLVINGPKRWPGATHVENEDGSMIDLSALSRAKREGLANRLGAPTSGAGNGNVDLQPGAAAAAAVAGEKTANGVGVKRVWRHLQVCRGVS
jgi:hypothetical protein